jgi:ABC-type phosphate transport system substrate-binding protein
MRKHILAVATVASVGVLGLTAAAQAQVTVSHGVAGLRAAQTSFAVPAGVATGVTLPCAKGTLTKFKDPGQPTSVNAVKQKSALELAGVWTKAGSDSVSLTCSGGSQSDKLTVEVAPQPTDVAGVGAQAQQEALDQLGTDYNATVSSSSPHLYYWDATNPITGAIGDTIVIKGTKTDRKTCAQARPDGSSAGIGSLETANPSIDGHPCIDYAASSRARGSSDPNTISFVSLAQDAVTYATEPAKGGGASNVPSNLTTADLNAIYSCKVTNWKQLGGGNGKPEIFLPLTSSGTRSFFLSAIGVAAAGPCANDLPTKAFPDGTLEQDEGVNPAFAKNPQDVIFPYSVGDYLAQRYHSAKCFSTACTAAKSGSHKGEICLPKGKDNLFGCDIHGVMQLNEVNGTAPTTPFPLTNTSKNPVINPGFSANLLRSLYEVVHSAEGTIPSNLAPLFGPKGFFCTSKTAKKALTDYGFLTLPSGTAAGDCGFAS